MKKNVIRMCCLADLLLIDLSAHLRPFFNSDGGFQLSAE